MDEQQTTITRRQALRDIGAAGLGISALGGLDALLAQAAGASPAHGSLADIEHVVFLIQENRSFDHYFGTLSGVRGFGDKHHRKVFHQRTLGGKEIQPFRLPKSCLPDISHEWGPQHRSWNGGEMDGWVSSREPSSVNGEAVAPETMGYYDREDLRFYYALADAFTICDAYHCSVLGPTDPNRLMSIGATLDPAGKHGGPLLQTNLIGRTAVFDWQTMPDRLSAHGITWKNYIDTPHGGGFDSVFSYFKQFAPGKPLYHRAIQPSYPADWLADLDADRLPQVSWLTPGFAVSEHPAFSTDVAGEGVARQVVEALLSRPKVWRKTALFITWDENGGFFDHVAPPTPRHGTKGEFLTVAQLPSAAEGIRGPIGLGFRVPMLVVSPFSRGGLVCSDVFDHTSMLRFLETRFRVRVPNLSHWRRRVTGDLTSTFNFAARPRYGHHIRLPRPKGAAQSCTGGTAVPVTKQPFPKQEKGKRKRPSGLVK